MSLEESAILDEKQMQEAQCAAGQHVPESFSMPVGDYWPTALRWWRCARCHETLYEVPDGP